MHAASRPTRLLAVAALLAVSSSVTRAQSWTATFLGATESPATPSAGTGSATFTLNGTVLTITGSFTGLGANTTASHIHCCTAAALTANAGVATQTPSFIGFPLGVTNGTFNLVLDLSNSASFNAAFVTANGGVDNARAALIAGMNSGRSYMNIHTAQFPGGEIRGFIISTVPEPSSVLLTTAGLFGVAMLGLRRRRNAH